MIERCTNTRDTTKVQIAMLESLPTALVLERWRPGSGDWDWPTEWADIVRHQGGNIIAKLINDIAVNGIATPVLLGDDGRV